MEGSVFNTLDKRVFFYVGFTGEKKLLRGKICAASLKQQTALIVYCSGMNELHVYCLKMINVSLR